MDRMGFKNGQWAVTDYGMETVPPEAPYEFEASRLLEVTDRPKGKFYDWPVHLAEKTWVDIEAFIEAFGEVNRPGFAGGCLF